MTLPSSLPPPADVGSWQAPEPAPREPWFTLRDLRVASVVVAVLTVAGVGHASGATNTVIEHLRLHVHIGSLRVVEPMAALLSYSILVAFAHRDDLGVVSVGVSHQT